MDDHPLWILHELNNIDKHRTLLVAKGGAGLVQGFIEFADGVIRLPKSDHLAGILRLSTEEDTPFLPISEYKPGAEMRIEGRIPPRAILFGSAVFRTVKPPVVEILRDLSKHVDGIISDFESELS